MIRLAAMRMLLGGFAAVFLLAGCGGGGETSQSQGPAPSGPAAVLAWTPPATYKNNVPMDPERDLDYYEIYVRQDPNFTESDQPMIQIGRKMTNGRSRRAGMTIVRPPPSSVIVERMPGTGSTLIRSPRPRP